MISEESKRPSEDDEATLRTRRAWISFPFSWMALLTSILIAPRLHSGFEVLLGFFGVPSGYALIIFSVPVLILLQIPLRRFWVIYSIRNGRAEIHRFPGVPESMPLLDTTLKRRNSLKAFLNFGTIEITSMNGLSVQQWLNVTRVDSVYEALLRASKGQSPDGSLTQTATYFDGEGNPIKPGTFNYLIARFGNIIQNIPGPARSAETVIDKPISVVWDFLANTSNFGNIIQGMWYWGELDRKTAKAGTTFQKGYNLNYYIVNWEQPHRFSMGPTLKSWEYDFRLRAVGSGTHVLFTRRFNIFGWLPIFHSTVNYTIDALEQEVRKSH
ncbi:MAG: Polyketide cyclase / dehydrase and lipid transport [Acidobacteria bacterium]|nr:Polyketide cyclase / dehydrase and lipid transport [Acidobacteriota bacterium]